jgi:hypothetical protein
MEAEGFDDHNARVMAPQEAIIIGKGSTASFATPTLLDA